MFGRSPHPFDRLMKNTPIHRQPVDRLTWLDGCVIGLLFSTALAGYGPLALRLATGSYFEYYNLAFDFDASRVFSLLTASQPDPIGFKHPLMLLFRPFGLALTTLGVPDKAAAGLVMAGTGAATLSLVYLFLRAALIARPEAISLSILFAVTGTQMMTSMITETYGFAGLSLIFVWLVAQLRLSSPTRYEKLRYVAAIMAAGVTITNAAQPVIAEILVMWRRWGARAAVPRVIRFAITFALLFAAVALLLWFPEIRDALGDPLASLKAVWWMQTKGPTTGLAKVLQTFLGFSFVSPEYTVVPLPESTRMIDFRDWLFPSYGGMFVAFWLVFLIVGTIAGIADAVYRPIAIAMLAALLWNVVFHMSFQYRGSLYIYAAHTHFLTFGLACGLARHLNNKLTRTTYVSAVLAMAIAIASVNIPLAIDFASRFDVPDTQCPAPCP
ncbi:conserved membrane hypothetical protein [uncultured Defluviicoccus sp.]|uniref:Glycosyltransferase RgtA/B/C/D-like domain-containing protein n=1 Tax=metagenome TaxID=256318 RepID=A0A380T9J2_9ZZZZ|nr:conserved membrane hypothetical protein [uncultured Defluviicoccus sp.]